MVIRCRRGKVASQTFRSAMNSVGDTVSFILAVEDDAKIRSFLVMALREQGHAVDEAVSLAEGETRALDGQHDLWIIDRRLPDGDGLTLLSSLRARRLETPALFLTASAELDQRIAGLEAGADDYLAKPFSVAELTLRVKALLRRRPTFLSPRQVLGNLTVDAVSRKVTVAGKEFTTTAHEWRLLSLMIEKPGQVFEREAIMQRVGMAQDADLVAVDHLISRLRLKLRACGAEVEFKTVRGVGFAVEVIVSPAARSG